MLGARSWLVKAGLPKVCPPKHHLHHRTPSDQLREKEE